jgi:hypothetical protein
MKNSAKCGDAMPIEPGNNVIDPAVGSSTGGFILDEFDDRDLLDLPNPSRPWRFFSTRRSASGGT